jgi:anti-sigma factor RsiW
MHLEPDQIERYLARELNPADRVAVSEHLATCLECRSRVASNPKFRIVAASAVTELTGVLPSGSLPKVVFGSARGRERLAFDMREKLECFAPGQAGPPAEGATIRTHFELIKSILVMEKPWALATVAAAVIAVACVGLWRYLPAQHQDRLLLTIEDSGRSLGLGPEGLIAGLHKQSSALADVNHDLQSLILNNKLAAPTIVQQLRETPGVILGDSQQASSFKLLTPIRTAIDTTTPTFLWNTCSGAAGYIVNVVSDDRSNSEAACSGVLPPPAANVSQVQWQLPQDKALIRGQRYRWYVTALVGKREIDSPALGEPRASFAILSESESKDLAALKGQTGGSRFLDGMLEVRAGLLDQALGNFQALHDAPHQNPPAKQFLSQTIREVESLKNNN